MTKSTNTTVLDADADADAVAVADAVVVADAVAVAGSSNSTDGGPDKGDLIIRDGFPALYDPNSSSSFKIWEGDEPLPRYGFWSSDDTLQFNTPKTLRTLQEDCEAVFTARDKPDGASYSAGETYFLPATMKPRCALEAIAMNIFHEHTKYLKEGTFNPAQSGANWWTLVLDENENENVEENTATTSASTVKVINDDNDDDDEEEVGEDEVGLHFDADYELEEQTGNILLHPRISTVTYLSDYGAPTLILNQKSPPMNDTNKITLEKGISTAWLSHPKLGKHIAFDGRFLHGAPALYFPSRKSVNKDDNNRDAKLNEPAPKRRKIIYENKKRYTLLVNIWLNHLVMDAGLLDDDVCSALTTPWEDNKSNLKGDDDYASSFVWNHNVDLTKPTKTEKIKLVPSNVDPAGEDEIALCNHNVTVKYNPLMSECHAASRLGSTVELELEKGAITLHVGQELSVDEDE